MKKNVRHCTEHLKEHLDQTRVLLWKNLTLHFNKGSLEAYIISIEVFWVFVCWGMAMATMPKPHLHDTYFSYDDLTNLTHHHQLRDLKGIFYYPNNSFTYKLMWQVSKEFELRKGVIHIYSYDYFDVEKHTKNKYFLREISKMDPLEDYYAAMVYFHNNDSDVIRNLKYSILFPYMPTFKCDTEELFPGEHDYRKAFTSGKLDFYIHSGFVPLQAAIDMAFIKLVSNKTDEELNHRIGMQHFKYPKRLLKPSSTIWKELSFALQGFFLIRRIKMALNKGKNNFMGAQGLNAPVFWIAWVIQTLIIYTPTVMFMTYISYISVLDSYLPFLTTTDSSVVIFMLYVYMLMNISLSVMIGTFARTYVATIIMTAITLIDDYYNRLYPEGVRWFLPSSRLTDGWEVISYAERTEQGITWSNINRHFKIESRQKSLLENILLMMVCIIIYAIMGWYLAGIFPARYCQREPPFSILKVKYWKRNFMDVKTGRSFPRSVSFTPDGEVEIKRLCWNYQYRKVLHDINLTCYKGDITCIIAANGCGKSTLLHLITGLYKKTCGHIKLLGVDIDDNLHEVQKVIGWCPQAPGIVFDNLTVKEHIMFFARIKGIPFQTAAKEAEDLMQIFRLDHYKNELVAELLEIKKARVLCATAFLSPNKVVLLDEPTEAMDINNRNKLWNAIRKMRNKNRAIILMTNNVEEAEIVGDRIVIINDARVQTAGTLSEIRSKFPKTYHLFFTKTARTDTRKLLTFIKTHIPDATVKMETETTVVIRIPAPFFAYIPPVLEILEENKLEYGIGGFGVSQNSLRDNYRRLMAKSQPADSETSIMSTFYENDMKHQLGRRHKLQMWRAMMLKKAGGFSNKRVSIFILLLVEIAIVCLSIFTIRHLVKTIYHTMPALDMNLNIYGNNTKVYHNKVNISTPVLEEMMKIYSTNLPKNTTFEATQDTDVLSGIQNDFSHDYTTARKELIVAVDFINTDDMVALYAIEPFHSAPISLHLATNTLLKHVMNDNNYSIYLINHPQTVSCPSVMDLQDSIALLIAIFLFAFDMVFIALLERFLQERESGSRAVELLTGLPLYIYWLTNFVYDYLFYIYVACHVAMIFFLADIIKGSDQASKLQDFFSVLLFHGIAEYWFIAVLSQTIAKFVSEAWILILATNILTLAPIVFIDDVTKDFQTFKLVFYEQPVISLIPTYPFAIYLFFWINWIIKNDKSEKTCPFGGTMLPLYLQVITIHKLILAAIFWIFILIILESKLCKSIFRKCYYCFKKEKTPVVYHHPLNADIDREKFQTIRYHKFLGSNYHGTQDLPPILVNNVVKIHGKQTLVNGVTFYVQAGECFGILGVEGCGKTTLLEIITRQRRMTSGSVIINNKDIRSKKTRLYLSQFGYCPETNAICELLTIKELLFMFGRLHGVVDIHLAAEVERWMRSLGLQEFQTIVYENCTIGIASKLKVAVALLGGLPIAILDEPTKGVDPISQRTIWKILGEQKNKAILVSTMNVEDCEMHCSKIAIMHNGEFICIDTPLGLKTRFAKGCIISIHLNPDTNEADVRRLKRAIGRQFTSATLQEDHFRYLAYHVDDLAVHVILCRMDCLLGVGCSHLRNVVGHYTIKDSMLGHIFNEFIE